MVLKALAVITGVLIFLQGCERIPEWEKKISKNTDEAAIVKYRETSKWLWTCRGILPNTSIEKGVGSRIEKFLDYFRTRLLSSLDTTERKTIRGSAVLWTAAGHLVSSLPWFAEVNEIECSNGYAPWLPAKVLGADKSLDLIVLHIELPEAYRMKGENRWVLRTDRPGLNENLTLINSVYPGTVDQIQVTPQPLHNSLQTSIDSDLSFFLPPPPAVLQGGLLVDAQWRALGYVLPIEDSPWGVAVSLSRVSSSVKSIVERGSVPRPYIGLRVRLDPKLGFAVQQIDIGGPAYQSGLRAQDILLRWDGTDLKALADWKDVLPDQIGKSIEVNYRRGDTVAETHLTPISSD